MKYINMEVLGITIAIIADKKWVLFMRMSSSFIGIRIGGNHEMVKGF